VHNVENITRGHEEEVGFSNLVGLMSGVQSKIFAVAVVASQPRTYRMLLGGLVRISLRTSRESNTLSVESDERINYLNVSTFDSHSINLVSAQVQPTITFTTTKKGRDLLKKQQRQLNSI
jgi:hypothetical protein